MFIRGVFVASLLGIFGLASTAFANSCSNVDIMGSFDWSGLRESEFGIYSAGTFRIAGEVDEAKQPMFNLALIDCEKKPDETGTVSLVCKVTRAAVWANPEKPNPDPDRPNCTLDLDTSEYSMKELQKGVLTGMEPFPSTSCYETMLTVDRNVKRVYMSYTRTQSADNLDRIRPGTCGLPPRAQVLMNCTYWAKHRHGSQTPPPRYCDFSSSSDK